MFILKRDGRKQSVSFDKITKRIVTLCDGLDPAVDPIVVAQKVVQGVYPGVTTSQLDELASETAASCSTQHPDFAKLAARISISNMHKNTEESFSKVISKAFGHIHPKTKQPAPLVSEQLFKVVEANKEKIEGAIKHDRDYLFEYFGSRDLSTCS
jgi:ATP cone domain